MTTKACDPFAAGMLRFSDENGLLPEGSVILTALSGGRDSMALLTALSLAAADRGWTVLAAHYDHGLRGEESRRDRDFVSAWCRDHGIPLAIGEGDVAGQAKRDRRGIEETARSMRYDFLYETARAVGASVIATAHNAEDNAETVLLHLTRGAGLDGLTGIPPRRGKLVRPLLASSRDEIDAFLSRNSIPWVEDSTNAQTVYARNRIRREVLPVLKELNPNLTETLTANLARLRADRDWLNAQAQPALDLAEKSPGRVTVPASALTELPPTVAVRVVKGLLAALDRWTVSAAHLEQVLSLAAREDPSAFVRIPGGVTARREYDRLVLTLNPEPRPLTEEVTVTGPGTYLLENGWTVVLTETVSRGEKGPFRCDLLLPVFPLTIRGRRTGDRLALPGRPEKTLKKWYIDEKLPRILRDGLPVLLQGETVLAAAGLGPNAGYPAPVGEKALSIEFLPEENHSGEIKPSKTAVSEQAR